MGEIKNLMEHALISSRGSKIEPEHLHFINDFDTPEPQTRPHYTAQLKPPTAAHACNDEASILSYIKEHGRIDNSATQALLKVERGRASYLLKKLLAEGKIGTQGERRWTHYTLIE